MQHLLWRGALALGLIGSGSAGALLMPGPATSPPACATAAIATVTTDGAVRPLAIVRSQPRAHGLRATASVQRDRG